MADGVDVLGDGDAAGGVAEAAGAVLRDEVGGDEDGIGMRQKVVWIVRGGVEEACLLLGDSTHRHRRASGHCKGS